MKVFLESDVECTVDGVGLLMPGKPVEVNLEQFKIYHGKEPGQANFPKSITVIYDTDRSSVGPTDAEAPLDEEEEA